MRATTMQHSRDVPLLYPACPSCGRVLRFARTVRGTDGLAELQTFNCRECSLWITESADGIPRGLIPKALSAFKPVFFRTPPPQALLPRLGSSFVRGCDRRSTRF